MTAKQPPLTHTPQSDELAALVHALPYLDGDARLMAVDAILTNLRANSPQVAKLVAGVVAGLDTQVGDELLQGIGAYQGVASWDEGQSLVDCLLLTIKAVELKAILAAFHVSYADSSLVDGNLRVWFVEHGGTRYCIAKVGTDGNTEAAIVFGRLFAALHPTSAAMVGMAGGLAEKVSPGDVVVAHHVYAYDFRKLTEEGERRRTKTYKVDDHRLRQSEDMEIIYPSWFSDVSHDLRDLINGGAEPGSVTPEPDWRPKVVRGDILAGSLLIEDGSMAERALREHDRVRAVEMEGAGFAAACDEVKIPWLLVRGIADIADASRNDGWQFGSTYAAARYLRDGLERGALSLT